MKKTHNVSPLLTFAAYFALQPALAVAQSSDDEEVVGSQSDAVVAEDDAGDEEVVADDAGDEEVVADDNASDEEVVADDDEVVAEGDEEVVGSDDDEVIADGDEEVVGSSDGEEVVAADSDEVVAESDDEVIAGGSAESSAAPPESVPEAEFAPGEEPYRAPPAGMGVVWGRLQDIDDGEPALEAQVKVRETGAEVFTDYDGYYRLELPPGSYTLEIFYELYEASTLSNVVVTAGNVVRVDEKLRPRQGAVDEEIIEDEAETQTIEGLALARQRSVSQGDAIGREEISKGTDSNAAEAAQRVVGANIVGGRFVYVRGLGERYTNSLLGGFPLPSPEPDKAAVPLDVFPASVLDSLTIEKTFTPDMPGDFAGGSVQIETRSVPSEPLFSATITGGVNTQATFQESLTYAGSPTDFLGFDSGKRKMPSSVPQNEFVYEINDKDRVNAIGRDVIDRMSPEKKVTPPNHGFSVVGGNSWNVGKKSQIGFLGSFNYSRKYESIQGATIREFRPNEEDPRGYEALTDFKYDEGAELIRWGAFGKVAFRIDENHKLTLSGLHSQLADDYTRSFSGKRADVQNDGYHATQLDWIQRGMTFGLLSGRHSFKELNRADFDWDVSLARADRSEPNRRDTVYVANSSNVFPQADGSLGPGFGYQNSDQSGRYFYANQKESSVGGKIDWRQPLIPEAKPMQMALKVGALANSKKRDFSVRRLRMQPTPGGDLYGVDGPGYCTGTTYPLNCPDPLFQEDNIPEYLQLVERPVEGDAYKGGLGVYAGYGMLDWEASPKLRVAAGARVEYTDQFVHPETAVGGPTTIEGADLRQTDVLPSVSLIFSGTEKSKTRYSYARTIARPTVREIAPFTFAAYFGGRAETGNPDLQLTTIDNFDARYEFWPSLTEVLAGSVFYKHLRLPIEKILIPSADSSVTVRYENAEQANVIGLELEARKMLSSFSPALNNFSVVANLTLSYSRTEVRQTGNNYVITNPSRSLINQAPWVVNFALDYSKKESGTNFRISYNINGPTLVLVGTRGIDDGYLQPRHSLDIGVSQKFLDHWSAKLQVENLINDDYLVTVGNDPQGEIWEQYRNGATISLGLGYDL